MAIKELLAKVDGRQRRINEMRSLASETVTSLRNYYKIGLTWSSNAMEGNTLTESETKVVIEDGLTIGGKPLRDHLEVHGHAEAFQEMMERTQKQTESRNIRFLQRQKRILNLCLFTPLSTATEEWQGLL